MKDYHLTWRVLIHTLVKIEKFANIDLVNIHN